MIYFCARDSNNNNFVRTITHTRTSLHRLTTSGRVVPMRTIGNEQNFNFQTCFDAFFIIPIRPGRESVTIFPTHSAPRVCLLIIFYPPARTVVRTKLKDFSRLRTRKKLELPSKTICRPPYTTRSYRLLTDDVHQPN